MGTVVTNYEKESGEGAEKIDGGIPMKGKKCSTNDIKFNRIKPRLNNQ